MEEKYYTPAIKEFGVGFEYEQKNSNNGWDKIVYGGEKAAAGWALPHDINIQLSVNYVRVKHLDKEDIESLGWNESILYTAQFEIKMILPEAVCGGIKINKITYFIDFIDENTLNIRMFNLDNIKYTMQKDNITPILIFHGKIKNKSELKKLMIQLGILKYTEGLIPFIKRTTKD